MKVLYLLLAVLFFLFQASSGFVDVAPADTIACRNQGNFCRLRTCPPTFEGTGTCHNGALLCCSK
ncbi:PREDICTED: gallinacin-10-like [Gavialis gangeticus]|nr:PREDICTED: gallinacin-10-like [Gavialis gangeticus]